MRNEPNDDSNITIADALIERKASGRGEQSAPCPAVLAAHQPTLAAPVAPSRSPRDVGQHEAELIVVARLTVASGNEDAVLAALPRLIAASIWMVRCESSTEWV